MNANDIIQTAIVIVILIICAIAIIRHFRRRKNCGCCDSTTCPFSKKRGHKADSD